MNVTQAARVAFLAYSWVVVINYALRPIRYNYDVISMILEIKDLGDIFNFIRRKRQHKQRTTAADKQTYKQL